MSEKAGSPAARLVFVSHSSRDTWVARQIAAAIEAAGATPFLDEAEVDAGADFEEDIRDFLARAHELVVLLTPWALDRPYVWAELGAAWSRGIPIVALLLGLSKSMQPMADHKVFISYSRPDTDWARSFAAALQQRGVPVWFDEFEIAPGESLREALESGLRESDVFVTVVNQDHPSRPNLFFELGAAIGMNKRVVAIVPKDFDPSQLPLEFRLRRYLLRDSPEETADELSHSLTAA